MSSNLLREDKTGKPDFTYIGEMYPVFARLMGRFQMGAEKYDRLNWRECKDPQTYKESFIRHALQYLNGQTDEPHLEAAIINGLILLDLEGQTLEPEELKGNFEFNVDVENSKPNECVCGQADCPLINTLDEIAKKAGLK